MYIYTHTQHKKMKTTLFSKNRDEKNYELFFESDELHRVQYLLETKQFGELSELQSSEDEDTGIKLKLSLAERGKLVTAQLFEYIMSAYEAVSPIMTFRNKEAVALSSRNARRIDIFLINGFPKIENRLFIYILKTYRR